MRLLGLFIQLMTMHGQHNIKYMRTYTEVYVHTRHVYLQ